jgi:ribonuclease E
VAQASVNNIAELQDAPIESLPPLELRLPEPGTADSDAAEGVDRENRRRRQRGRGRQRAEGEQAELNEQGQVQEGPQADAAASEEAPAAAEGGEQASGEERGEERGERRERRERRPRRERGDRGDRAERQDRTDGENAEAGQDAAAETLPQVAETAAIEVQSSEPVAVESVAVAVSEPAEAVQAPVLAAAPAAVIEAPAAPVETAPVATRYQLPLGELDAVATQAGLVWVQSDAGKVAAVAASMAAEPKKVHVPRVIAPVTLPDHGPLVLVETRKDLADVKLPFDA